MLLVSIVIPHMSMFGSTVDCGEVLSVGGQAESWDY